MTPEAKNASQLRIVLLIDRYWPILGGAQNNVHELSRRLIKRGLNVQVLTRRVYARLKKTETVDGVPVRRFSFARNRVISKILCALRISWFLLAKRNDYDIVMCVPCAEVTELLPAYLANKITGRPYVVRMTGMPTFEVTPPKTISSVTSSVMRALTPRSIWLNALRSSRMLVAQSEVLSELPAKHNVPHSLVISNGVDTSRFRPPRAGERSTLRDRLSLPGDKVLLINTGRYDKEKNQITLLKAAKAIESRLRPGAAHIVILGATQRDHPTSNEAELKEYVREQDLERFVTFVDDAANVDEYLRASDIFVQPTTREGMSNALLEAMASGLAMVCSDLPQNTCVFPDGAGLFFPATDVEQLTSHIVELLDTEEQRVRLAELASDYAAEHYCNDKLALRYEEMFREIAENK